MQDLLAQPVTSWHEPDADAAGIDPKRRILLIFGTVGVAVIIALVAFFSGEPTLYGAIVVAFAALAAVLAQSKRGRVGREIQLSTRELTVDGRSYPLDQIAGFWVYQDVEGLLVIIEYKKPALLPLTLFSDTQNVAEIRARLHPAMPELEPRQNHLDTGIVSRFRF